MLRRAFIVACLLTLAFAAGAPAQALAHASHVHVTQVEAFATGDADSVQVDRHEAEAASVHSRSAPADSGPKDDCHCPACHGCCHAPALSDASVQLAPFALRAHAAPRDDGWPMRRWRSAIENPPRTFA